MYYSISINVEQKTEIFCFPVQMLFQAQQVTSLLVKATTLDRELNCKGNYPFFSQISHRNNFTAHQKS